MDPRDNYTLSQCTPEQGFLPFLTTSYVLHGARFGLPWLSFWQYADTYQQEQLLELVSLIEGAGTSIINGTELPSRKKVIPEDGWDWDYGTKRGYPNESEFTYVKTDFYNDIAKYLSEVHNTHIKSVEDIVQFNIDNAASHGGTPGIHPAFPSGQDRLLESSETKGVMNETYW